MGSKEQYQGSEDICPYWSLATKSCLYTKKGLYLPIAEHIQTYCQTSNYSSCSQLQGESLSHSPSLFPETVPNRRRYERIPTRFAFRLSGCLKNQDLIPLLDDNASTVDISQGGIRFESFHKIPIGSLVSFSLIDNSPDEPLEGIGRVKWCKSLHDAPIFHAGISFADKSAAAKVRSRLGLFVQ